MEYYIRDRTEGRRERGRERGGEGEGQEGEAEGKRQREREVRERSERGGKREGERGRNRGYREGRERGGEGERQRRKRAWREGERGGMEREREGGETERLTLLETEIGHCDWVIPRDFFFFFQKILVCMSLGFSLHNTMRGKSSPRRADSLTTHDVPGRYGARRLFCFLVWFGFSHVWVT